MNLDLPGSPHRAPLEPADWTLELELQPGHYVGVVFQSSIKRCRLSISSDELSEAEARTRLADKAREWIAEFLERKNH